MQHFVLRGPRPHAPVVPPFPCAAASVSARGEAAWWHAINEHYAIKTSVTVAESCQGLPLSHATALSLRRKQQLNLPMRALFIIDVRSRHLYPSAAVWGEQVACMGMS